MKTAFALASAFAMMSYFALVNTGDIDESRQHEELRFARMRVGKNLLLSASVYLQECIQETEKSAGNSANWIDYRLSHLSDPLYVKNSLDPESDNPFKEMRDAFIRVCAVSLIVRNEAAVQSLPVHQRYAKYSELYRSHDVEAKKLADKCLEPYVSALEEMKRLKARSDVVNLEFPKCSVETWNAVIKNDNSALAIVQDFLGY